MNRLRHTLDLPAVRQAPRLGATRVLIIFDDGFHHSTQRTAELYEQHGFRALFAVNAVPSRTPHAGDSQLCNWAELRRWRARGHHIEPHGLDHANEATLAPGLAIHRLSRCLTLFRHHLPGFDATRSIFHYPYNTGSPVLHRWLLAQCGAVRIGGAGANHLRDLARGVVHCTAHGPEHCDEHLHHCLDRVAHEQPPLFIYNAHGLDHEGWGPLRATALGAALARLRR
jgi:hypothetical protein